MPQPVTLARITPTLERFEGAFLCCTDCNAAPRWRAPFFTGNSTEMRTLEVGLSVFKNSYGGNNWPLQMTAAVIVMAPLLVAFLFLQRYWQGGLTFGSVKT